MKEAEWELRTFDWGQVADGLRHILNANRTDALTELDASSLCADEKKGVKALVRVTPTPK